MILKCSTAALPDIAARGYITAKLDKGGYEVQRRKKLKIKDQVKYSGQISFENILRIAKQLEVDGKSQAKSFEGTVKSVLATTATLGLRITGGKHPKFVLDKIAQQKWPVPPMESVVKLLDSRGIPANLVILPESTEPKTPADVEEETAAISNISLDEPFAAQEPQSSSDEDEDEGSDSK